MIDTSGPKRLLLVSNGRSGAENGDFEVKLVRIPRTCQEFSHSLFRERFWPLNGLTFILAYHIIISLEPTLLFCGLIVSRCCNFIRLGNGTHGVVFIAG
jgi:hypothetical protein